MITRTDRKLITHTAAVIVFAAVSAAVLAQVPKSEVCLPPFLGRPDLTEAVACRPLLPGVLLQLSIDILLCTVGIFLLTTVVYWMSSFRRPSQNA
jgi:hypothetical protein